MTPESPAERRLARLIRFGRDAVSFQGLESGMRWWDDTDAPDGTGASVAYVESGRSWIAVGRPLAEPQDWTSASRRFAAAARARGRRPMFFGVESLTPFDGFRRLPLGLQSVLDPARWAGTLRSSRKLREQLRRARAKGVTARVVAASELAPGAPLRREVERLCREWLATRPMEPMAFLVAVEPFHHPDEHLYVVAERHGRAVQFLSAVPIYEQRGWLFEDMLRGADAPNGSTELLIDRAMAEIRGDARRVTPGLTPLAGAMPWWLRVARVVTTPLYDFGGLRRFRARLSPQAWEPVWLVWDRGPAPFVLVDVLRAFAGGRLVPFASRSLLRHAGGPPWAVGVPLVVWTALLAVLLATSRAGWLGFSGAALLAWIVFDVVLAALLLRTARRPRGSRLVALTMAAAVDAVLSLRHLAIAGLGGSVVTAVLRMAAVAGPVVGTAALAWASYWALTAATRRARMIDQPGATGAA